MWQLQIANLYSFLTFIFHKIDQKSEKHYITFAFHHFNKYSSNRVEFIYKSVKRVIQYFCFLNRSIKGEDILDFYKGGILEKKGGGGMPPLTNYVSIG